MSPIGDYSQGVFFTGNFICNFTGIAIFPLRDSISGSLRFFWDIIAYIKVSIWLYIQSFRKLQKPPRVFKTIQSLTFEINIVQFFITAVVAVLARQQRSLRISCFIMEKTSPILWEILYFLVELKTLFVDSFQGSQTQFQSQRLVMLQTDIHVTADLYHAKQPDKPRLVWRKKKHAVVYLLACTWVYTVCLHLEQAFKTVLEEMKLDTDVLEETFTLKLELVLFPTYRQLVHE